MGAAMSVVWAAAAAALVLRVRGDDVGGDEDDLPAHEPFGFTCSTWAELNVTASVLGHGHYREAHAASFRGQALVLKVPFSGWAAPGAVQAAMFRAELARLLRMKHPSVPQLFGYCLEPPRVALLCERLLTLADVVRDASLGWAARLNIAISAARMLQYWDAYVDRRGVASPRFFWDLKANNVGTDVARTHVKILDVESFSPHVRIADHHDTPPTCARDSDCCPTRLSRFHDPVLQNLSELRCNATSRTCTGVLDSRTNVFRVCLIVIAPLLSSVHVPERAGVAADLKRLLQRCMDYDHDARSTPTELRLALESLRSELKFAHQDSRHEHAPLAAAAPGNRHAQSIFDLL
jgi:hypothetical protein